jgi:hypothetical protein
MSNFSRKASDESKHIEMPRDIQNEIEKFCKKIISSNMITMTEDIEFVELLLQSKLELFEQKQFKLLYRGSENEFSAKRFHELCDNHGPTICLIKSNFGNIFGGYTSIKWAANSYNMYQYQKISHKDIDAFLFLIRDQSNNNKKAQGPEIFECIKDDSVYHLKSNGPSFGFADIRISDECNNITSHTRSNSYNHHGIKAPICGQSADSDPSNKTRPGFFYVLDYEVFEIQ